MSIINSHLIHLSPDPMTSLIIFSSVKIDRVPLLPLHILPLSPPPAINLQITNPHHAPQTTSLLQVLMSVVEVEVLVPVVVISQLSPPVLHVARARLSLAVLKLTF